ncbi:Alpha/Beta hydrolase protein [Cyathus striatus]|nr:Alpha/Beta hydrolase protein [Cyathus striatus]
MVFDFTASQTQYYRHGRLRVESGVLPDAITAYRTYGDSSNPCLVFPTCYGGKLDNSGLLGQEYLVGEDKVLNPSKYFVVTFALFSNGESSSPSNTPPPYNGPYFPAISYEDNIRAQYAVLQHLGVKKVLMVVGFSMGGQQAYHWPVIFPDYVEKYVVICGSARTSPHNKCFLEGPKAALVASKDFDNGHYKSTPQHGIRASEEYTAHGHTDKQCWFREHQYTHDGIYPDLAAFLRERWEAGFLNNWDANDLLTLLTTWQTGDVSKIRHGGDLKKCLGEIKAKGLIMPSKTDLYFPPEDSQDEIAALGDSARLVIIDSVWGHVEDNDFLQDEVRKFLEE